MLTLNVRTNNVGFQKALLYILRVYIIIVSGMAINASCGEAPFLEISEIWSHPFVSIISWFTLTQTRLGLIYGSNRSV